jgi:hypothetical protein
MTVSWQVAPCSRVQTGRRFRSGSDDGGNKYLWNIGQFLSECSAQHPRWQPSLCSPPWEPEIQNLSPFVRFQVLKATNMKIIASWHIVPCSLVEVYRLFRGAYCLYHRPDDGGNTYLWKSVGFNESTWHYIPEENYRIVSLCSKYYYTEHYIAKCPRLYILPVER